MTDTTAFLTNADPLNCRKALTTICAGALTPAFGAVTKRELELLVFEALIVVGMLTSTPTVYEVMQTLRVTRARAPCYSTATSAGMGPHSLTSWRGRPSAIPCCRGRDTQLFWILTTRC